MNELNLTDYERSFLVRKTNDIFDNLQTSISEDDWHEVIVDDVIYDINFFKEDGFDNIHCTAYATYKRGKSEAFRETDGNTFTRLW